MNYQKFKSIHYYSSLIISALIIFPLSDNMGWNLKWWLILPIYFIIQYIGRFLYVYFSGFVISKIQFLDIDSEVQVFVMYYQMGFSKMYSIYGEFDNEIGLTERNLKLLIYCQATRKTLKNTIKFGETTEIEFDFHGARVPVLFVPPF